MKTVEFDDDACGRLERRRGEDETFSDVVRRVTDERSLLEIAGILSEEGTDAMRAAIDELRLSGDAGTRRRGG